MHAGADGLQVEHSPAAIPRIRIHAVAGVQDFVPMSSLDMSLAERGEIYHAQSRHNHNLEKPAQPHDHQSDGGSQGHEDATADDPWADDMQPEHYARLRPEGPVEVDAYSDDWDDSAVL